MGGASLLAYAGLRLASGGRFEAAVTAASMTWAALAVNGSHFAATNYRLYRSPEAARQFPLTAALVPAVVLCGVAASLAWPARIAPYFVKLFLLWSPYHYSGQTVGLSVLYGRRARQELSALERRLLSAFVYGTFVASAARSEAGLNRGDYMGIPYPFLGVPGWIATAALAAVAACGLTLAALWLRRAREGRGLPALAWLPPLAQLVWFIPGPGTPAFYALVPMFHGAQYLLVAWSLHLGERRQEEERTGPAFAAAETARFAAWNLAGYAALFWGLPQLLALGTGRPYTLAAPVFVAGVQLHHFFVDGVIWRLRRPRTARALGAPAAAGAAA